MTRAEAIRQAKKLSEEGRQLAIVFDKEYQDFFITEGELAFINDDFYSTSPYEIVRIYAQTACCSIVIVHNSFPKVYFLAINVISLANLEKFC